MNRKAMSAASSLLVVALALLALAGTANAQTGTTVGTGLNGPQGVLVAPDGTIWVADSGLGGEEKIGTISSPTGEPVTVTLGITARVVAIAPDGTQTVATTLPSVTFGGETGGGGRLALHNGTLYLTTGVWNEGFGAESRPLTAVVASLAGGQATAVADTWAFEKANNPDPNLLDSHPYDLEVGPDGMLWVADAGGNDLLKVDPASGKIELVTVFAGLPGPMANPTRGGAQEIDPVPTGIAFDGSGNVYVSLLPGFPFLPGSSKVVKVGSSGGVSDYATGLTMVTDLKTGPDGQIYAVSLGQFTQQGPVPNSGAVLRIKEGSATEVVLGGLSFPTSIDFNDAGDAYVTLNGVGAPGSGQVVRFDKLTAMAGSRLPAPATAPDAGPATLPETGGSALGLPWILLAAGFILAMAGLTIRARQRREPATESVRR